MATIKKVRKYWEKHTPQSRYSKREKGTKEYYDEIQEVRYSVVYPYLTKLAEFKEHPNEKVLEVGCGQGTDLLQFAKGGAEVFGVDLTESAIEKTRKMFEVCGYDVRLKRMNAEDLSCFGDNFFDVIYSFGVIHHTPNPQKVRDEIYRILKPNGKIIIMIYAPGLSWWHYLRLFIFKGEFLKQSFQETINKYSESGNNPLTRLYSKRQAKKMFDCFRKLQIKQLYIYGEANRKDIHFYTRIIINLIKKIPFLENIFGAHLFIKGIK